ncbi:hypothetical protein [Streptomyces achromogenes]|uniref:hypothetical protein n=1 Tax=Streptomyces achromogenes TaxID=67255 RepID=UPI003A80C3D5
MSDNPTPVRPAGLVVEFEVDPVEQMARALAAATYFNPLRAYVPASRFMDQARQILGVTETEADEEHA